MPDAKIRMSLTQGRVYRARKSPMTNGRNNHRMPRGRHTPLEHCAAMNAGGINPPLRGRVLLVEKYDRPSKWRTVTF